MWKIRKPHWTEVSGLSQVVLCAPHHKYKPQEYLPWFTLFKASLPLLHVPQMPFNKICCNLRQFWRYAYHNTLCIPPNLLWIPSILHVTNYFSTKTSFFQEDKIRHYCKKQCTKRHLNLLPPLREKSSITISCFEDKLQKALHGSSKREERYC